MTRYTMPARSQGRLCAQRGIITRLRDTHRWVFVHDLAPEVEPRVRKWLTVRLNRFYCDLQDMYTPDLRLHPLPAIQARTHIVLNNTPQPPSLARDDEAVEVNARGLSARDAAKALVKATGLNPHLSVCGWPFCLGDLDDAHTGGGEV